MERLRADGDQGEKNPAMTPGQVIPQSPDLAPVVPPAVSKPGRRVTDTQQQIDRVNDILRQVSVLTGYQPAPRIARPPAKRRGRPPKPKPEAVPDAQQPQPQATKSTRKGKAGQATQTRSLSRQPQPPTDGKVQKSQPPAAASKPLEKDAIRAVGQPPLRQQPAQPLVAVKGEQSRQQSKVSKAEEKPKIPATRVNGKIQQTSPAVQKQPPQSVTNVTVKVEKSQPLLNGTRPEEKPSVRLMSAAGQAPQAVQKLLLQSATKVKVEQAHRQPQQNVKGAKGTSKVPASVNGRVARTAAPARMLPPKTAANTSVKLKPTPGQRIAVRPDQTIKIPEAASGPVVQAAAPTRIPPPKSALNATINVEPTPAQRIAVRPDEKLKIAASVNGTVAQIVAPTRVLPPRTVPNARITIEPTSAQRDAVRTEERIKIPAAVDRPVAQRRAPMPKLLPQVKVNIRNELAMLRVHYALKARAAEPLLSQPTSAAMIAQRRAVPLLPKPVQQPIPEEESDIPEEAPPVLEAMGNAVLLNNEHRNPATVPMVGTSKGNRQVAADPSAMPTLEAEKHEMGPLREKFGDELAPVLRRLEEREIEDKLQEEKRCLMEKLSLIPRPLSPKAQSMADAMLLLQEEEILEHQQQSKVKLNAKERICLAQLYHDHYMIYHAARYRDHKYVYPDSSVKDLLIKRWAVEVNKVGGLDRTPADVEERIDEMIAEVTEFRRQKDENPEHVVQMPGVQSTPSFLLINNVYEYRRCRREDKRITAHMNRYERFLLHQREAEILMTVPEDEPWTQAEKDVLEDLYDEVIYESNILSQAGLDSRRETCELYSQKLAEVSGIKRAAINIERRICKFRTEYKYYLVTKMDDELLDPLAFTVSKVLANSLEFEIFIDLEQMLQRIRQIHLEVIEEEKRNPSKPLEPEPEPPQTTPFPPADACRKNRHHLSARECTWLGMLYRRNHEIYEMSKSSIRKWVLLKKWAHDLSKFGVARRGPKQLASKIAAYKNIVKNMKRLEREGPSFLKKLSQTKRRKIQRPMSPVTRFFDLEDPGPTDDATSEKIDSYYDESIKLRDFPYSHDPPPKKPRQSRKKTSEEEPEPVTVNPQIVEAMQQSAPVHPSQPTSSHSLPPPPPPLPPPSLPPLPPPLPPPVYVPPSEYVPSPQKTRVILAPPPGCVPPLQQPLPALPPAIPRSFEPKPAPSRVQTSPRKPNKRRHDSAVVLKVVHAVQPDPEDIIQTCERLQDDCQKMANAGINCLTYDVIDPSGVITKLAMTREESQRDVDYYLWAKYMDVEMDQPMSFYVCFLCEQMSIASPAEKKNERKRNAYVQPSMPSSNLLAQQALPTIAVSRDRQIPISWTRSTPKHRCVPYLLSQVCERLCSMSHMVNRTSRFPDESRETEQMDIKPASQDKTHPPVQEAADSEVVDVERVESPVEMKPEPILFETKPLII